MAQQSHFSSPPLQASRFRAMRDTQRNATYPLLVLSTVLTTAISAAAQTPQQQYVYGSVRMTPTTSEVVGFSKDGLSGALTSVANSPFPDRLQGGLMAVDAKGRFLFLINPSTSNISMFQIDPNTGSLTEVPASPFSTGPTENPNMAPTSPACLATEASGQFVYVGYRFGNLPEHGAINEYVIDATGLQLVPIAGQESTDIPSRPIGLITDSKGLHLYVGLAPNPAVGNETGSASVYSIDSITGRLNAVGSAGNSNSNEQSIAIDTRGRFFFDGWGDANESFIESVLISPADGTATTGFSSLSLGPSNSASAMLAENTGRFLYVQQIKAAYVYLIDQATGALTPAQNLPTVVHFQSGSAAVDPLGPYIYSLEETGIHAFQIDPQSGALSEIPGSPFPVAFPGPGGLAISGAPVQAVSGPVAALFPSSEAFGSFAIGQSSSSRIVSLTNTGDQALSLAPFSVTGANKADFHAAPNCPALLHPNGTCTISLLFTPAAAGLRRASLTATDNAPGSPQSVQLTGTGTAPEPAVTLTPGTVSFGTINQGGTSTPQVVTLTNSGLATLHVSSVLLSGSNPNDFQMTNRCSGDYPVNASCTISLAFSPLGDGQRAAAITITDDAPASPQSVQLTGIGSGPPVAKPAVTLAPATVSFGTITQGATSGPQKITVTNAGTAPLHLSSVLLGGANHIEFSMTNGCTSATYPVNATCTIALTFAPLATGQRTATLTIKDDAPNSPQTIAVDGNVAAAFTVTGGLSATVTAGQTATYNLQLVPGKGFVGDVSFTCTGAPTAATCSVPSRTTVSNPVALVVSVATTGSGVMNPFSDAPRSMPFAGLRVLSLFTILALVLLLRSMYETLRWNAPARQWICGGVFAALMTIVVFDVAACGGGSTVAQSAPATQPIVTPQGTSTITVTPTATTQSGTQLAPMPPIQLTLTVK
jgi:6-phosphogluconolactonase (cycloisomerase 2 family)